MRSLGYYKIKQGVLQQNLDKYYQFEELDKICVDFNRIMEEKDSCLNEQERKQVMEMLYEYKDVFSLRDEIGTCPNIEVNIEVTDNSPFFIRP